MARPNKAPIANNDTVTTNEDQPVTFNVLLNDRDLNGDTFTVTAINNLSIEVGTSVAVTGGTVALNSDGTLTFTPSPDYFGTPSFTYTLSDPLVSFKSTATVSIVVDPVNDAPRGSATATLLDGTEDTVYTGTLASLLEGFSDVDGGTLAVSDLTASNGTLVVNSTEGTFTFTPNTDHNGPVTLSYNVLDSQGGSTAATQSFSLAPVNDAPSDIVLISGGRVSETAEAGTPVASLGAVDSDADEVFTFSLKQDLSGFFELVGSSIQVKAGAQIDYEAATSHDVTVTATDSAGSSYDKVLTIEVDDIWGSFVGTDAAEVLNGTSDEDWIWGRGGNDKLYGRAGRDELYGESGNDVLNGGAGTDRLKGGTGNDTYVVTSGDVVVEAADAGIDTVRADHSYKLGANVENLVLTGTSALNGTGNWLANRITGNNAANLLSGGGGNDRLLGHGGNDRLIGGAGKDIVSGGMGNDAFQFNSRSEGGDVITDFRNVSGNNDHLRIDASSFGGGLVAGRWLASSQFQVRNDNLAQDSNDRFIFEKDAAKLWYDNNGSASGGLTLVADLQADATVTAADIWLI